MGDGKALQMGTSHELGQNFARAFGIQFSSDTGSQEYVWQTSWGASTRLVGALDHGPRRRLPACACRPGWPRCRWWCCWFATRRAPAGPPPPWWRSCGGAGHRVRLDDRVETSFGRRSVDWELKGVPVRVEVGPRDLAVGQVTLVRTGSPGEAAASPLGARRGRRLRPIWRPPSRRSTPRRRPRQTEPHPAGGDPRRGRRGGRGGFAVLSWDHVGGRRRSDAGGGRIQRSLPPGGRWEPRWPSDDEPGLVAVVAQAY